MQYSSIIINGANEHNLKNIKLDIPKNKLIVFTGVSGSGKSSLAFDTIYAEGQRRYVESLSAYARQFLELMQKPKVESIEGLSPAIAINQKTVSHNPRSTVATVTEIYDYLRLLFARVGTAYSPTPGLPITSQTITQMVDSILNINLGTRIHLLAPIVRSRKGEHKKDIEDLKKTKASAVIIGEEHKQLARCDTLIGKDAYLLYAKATQIFKEIPATKLINFNVILPATKMGDNEDFNL